jgi:hypothetical protein
MESIRDSTTLLLIVAFIVALYAAYIRVSIPASLNPLFQNGIFQFIFFFLLLYVCTTVPASVALIVSLLFVVILYILDSLQKREQFDNMSNWKDTIMTKLQQWKDMIVSKYANMNPQLSGEQVEKTLAEYKKSIAVKLSQYGFSPEEIMQKQAEFTNSFRSATQ